MLLPEFTQKERWWFLLYTYLPSLVHA